jgi:hypothetical protein
MGDGVLEPAAGRTPLKHYRTARYAKFCKILLNDPFRALLNFETATAREGPKNNDLSSLRRTAVPDFTNEK